MAEYDTIPKQLMHLYPQRPHPLGTRTARRSKLKLKKSSTPNSPRWKRALVDSLMRVRIDGEEALIHIEFQNLG